MYRNVQILRPNRVPKIQGPHIMKSDLFLIFLHFSLRQCQTKHSDLHGVDSSIKDVRTEGRGMAQSGQNRTRGGVDFYYISRTSFTDGISDVFQGHKRRESPNRRNLLTYRHRSFRVLRHIRQTSPLSIGCVAASSVCLIRQQNVTENKVKARGSIHER